jgi:hypothetical protein
MVGTVRHRIWCSWSDEATQSLNEVVMINLRVLSIPRLPRLPLRSQSGSGYLAP